MSRGGARARDLRLIPVALATWIAAALGTHLPDVASLLAAGAWVATVAALAGAARSRRATASCAIAAGALAMAGTVLAHVAIVQPQRAAAVAVDMDGGRALTITGVVVGKVERSAIGHRFDAVAGAITVGDRRHETAVPIEVRVSGVPPGLDIGARFRVTATAFPAEPGERAVLIVDAIAPPAVEEAPQGVFAAASALRVGLGAITRQLPPPGAGLIAGLAVGDTSAVPGTLDADMKETSLAHLTAVSGKRCAL